MNRIKKIFLCTMLGATLLIAANPGIPFTENFTNQNLMDASLTTADWDTDLQELRMQPGKQVFLPGAVCGSESALSGPGNAQDVAVGDLNMDGLPDAVVANYGGTTMIYYNSGVGVDSVIFQHPFMNAPVNLTADTFNTQAVAIGDMNGDSYPDIVEVNDGANYLYLNNTTANPFNSVAGIQIGTETFDTEDIILVDVDLDGHIDICTAERNSVNKVYINNRSNDPFNGVTALDIAADNHLSMDIASADFDQDGYPDLVVANDSNAYCNRLYINDQTADPFKTGTDIGTDQENSYSIAAGDFDANGNIDVIVGNSGINKVYFHDNTGDPFDTAGTGMGIGADSDTTNDVIAFDINQDGAMDVIAINGASATNKVYLSKGDFDPFSGPDTITLTSSADSSNAVGVCDFDLDGTVDFLTANVVMDNKFVFNKINANPFNGEEIDTVNTDTPDAVEIAVGDVNNDGLDDLVVAVWGNQNRLYINNTMGSQPFDMSSGLDIFTDVEVTSDILLADINNDGLLDVVAVNSATDSRVYFNDGDADPFSLAGYALNGSSSFTTSSVDAADLDLDGDIDLVLGVSGSSINKVYLHDGDADPYNSIAVLDVDSDLFDTRAVKIGDLNNDGYPDLVTANYNQVNRYYLNNKTADPFTSPSGADLTSDIQNATCLDFADFDCDGNLDVVFGNYGQYNAVFLNDGVGDPFDNAEQVTLQEDAMRNTQAIKAEDVDLDGDMDIVAVNDSNQSDILYINSGSKDTTMFDELGVVVCSASNGRDLAFGRFLRKGYRDLLISENGVGKENMVIKHQGVNRPLIGRKKNLDSGETNPKRRLASGDIDNDGDIDFVMAMQGAPNLLYLNNGTNTPFESVTPIEITSESVMTEGIVLADFNQDGYLDVAFGNQDTTSDKFVLNNGTSDPFNGVAAVEVSSSDTYDSRDMKAADINEDGYPDLVIAGDSGTYIYLWESASSTFLAGTPLLNSSTYPTNALAIDDFNVDGHLDIVLGNQNQVNVIYYHEGDANPFDTSAAVTISTNAFFTFSITSGDVDNDGLPDIVVGNVNDMNWLYINNGASNPFPGSSEVQVNPTDIDTFDVVLADLNLDGYLDVISGSSPGPTFHRNDRAGGFDLELTLSGEVTYTRRVAVDDFTGDGYPDILSHGYYGPVQLFEQFAYNSNTQCVTSLQVNSGFLMPSAVLDSTTYPYANTSVDYFMTNDGGSNWFKVKPGIELIFPTVGTDVRWRAYLKSHTPRESEEIFTITVQGPETDIVSGEIFWGGGCAALNLQSPLGDGSGFVFALLMTLVLFLMLWKRGKSIKQVLMVLILFSIPAMLSAQDIEDDSLEIPDELKDALFEFEEEKPEEKQPEKDSEIEKKPDPVEEPADIDDMFQEAEKKIIKTPAKPVDASSKNMFFGVNVDFYVPADSEFVGLMGFGAIFTLKLSQDSYLDIGGHVFEVLDESGSTYPYDASVFTLRGSYLKFFNGFFIGAGGGVGQASYEHLEEKSGFIFAELKTGYAITETNRIELRIMQPLNTENTTTTLAIGYDLLF